MTHTLLDPNENSASSPSATAGRGQGAQGSARLRFCDIAHRFGREEVLRGVSLTAEPSEVLCLLGPSGSGKTTLLRIAAGIEQQGSGQIFLDDREIAGPSVFLPPERRSIGLVFQDFALFPHLTLADNIRFGLKHLPAAERRGRAVEALERVGLGSFTDVYPHTLSGGQQQRVALARALAPRPDILLMDEPFSGLDTRLKEQVRSDTLALLRDSCTTTIIVTHDAEEAMRICDRIALLREGRLVQVGTAEAIYRSPANLFAATFFSDLNLLAGHRVTDGGVDTPLGRFDAGHLRDGDLADIAIRQIGIDCTRDLGEIAGTILSRRFVGASEMLEIAVDGLSQPLRATIREGTLSEGLGPVKLSLRPRDVLVFAAGDLYT